MIYSMLNKYPDPYINRGTLRKRWSCLFQLFRYQHLSVCHDPMIPSESNKLTFAIIGVDFSINSFSFLLVDEESFPSKFSTILPCLQKINFYLETRSEMHSDNYRKLFRMSRSETKTRLLGISNGIMMELGYNTPRQYRNSVTSGCSELSNNITIVRQREIEQEALTVLASGLPPTSTFLVNCDYRHYHVIMTNIRGQ